MSKVSVLIPVKDMEAWLGQAIESVLGQTRKPDEVIVWDDGSKDGTYSVAMSYAGQGVKVMRWEDGQNRGAGAACRQMIAMAEGDIIVPFAADDILEPTFIERGLAELEAHPAALMVACHPAFMDPAGAPITDPAKDVRLQIAKPVNLPREQFLQDLRAGNKYFGAGMYRASTFVKVGLFDNELKWLSDWDYYLRVLKVGELRVIEEPLCRYRLHDQALSLITNDKLSTQARLFRQIREKHFAPTVRKVAIATPHYMNLCFSNYKASLIGVIDYLTKRGIGWDCIDLNGDSYVDRAKNTLAMKFLESDCTDLMMIDSDMTFPPQAVERLMNWDQDIVAGAFPMKNNWGSFVGNPKIQPDGTMMGHQLTDGSYLLQADRVAGGFLRIKRAALNKFADAYPERIYLDPSADPSNRARIYVDFFECARRDYTRHGEDMFFSKLCREAGIELFIDTNITFGHYGINAWSGNYHEALQQETAKTHAAQAEAGQAHVAAEMERLRKEAEGTVATSEPANGAPIAVTEKPLAEAAA